MPANDLRPRGVTVLSLLWWWSALFNFLSGTLAALLPEEVVLAAGPVGALLKSLSGGLVLLALIQVAIGAGLWLMRPWARTAAIAFALASLVNFPIGTLLGLIALGYLFRPQVREAFEGVAGTPPERPTRAS